MLNPKESWNLGIPVLVVCSYVNAGDDDYLGMSVFVDGNEYRSGIDSDRRFLTHNRVILNLAEYSCKREDSNIERIFCLLNFTTSSKVCGILQNISDCFPGKGKMINKCIKAIYNLFFF